jgi:ABC-type methionine transport system ATPase subunit
VHACKRQLRATETGAARVRAPRMLTPPRPRERAAIAVKTKKNIHFEFDQELVREPLLYKINRSFDVVVNIRGASVTDQGGFIALELEGEKEEVERVLDYLRGQGVRLGEGLGSPER